MKMGTNNFYKINLDDYNILFEDTEDCLNDTKENIINDLKEKLLLKSFKEYTIREIDKTSDYSLRSYYRHNFLDLGTTFKDYYVGFMINFTNGYYENGCFDVDFYIDGDTFSFDDLNLDHLKDYKVVFESVKIQKLYNLIIKTLELYTIKLHKVGGFSNGEAIYKEVL